MRFIIVLICCLIIPSQGFSFGFRIGTNGFQFGVGHGSHPTHFTNVRDMFQTDPKPPLFSNPSISPPLRPPTQSVVVLESFPTIPTTISTTTGLQPEPIETLKFQSEPTETQEFVESYEVDTSDYHNIRPYNDPTNLEAQKIVRHWEAREGRQAFDLKRAEEAHHIEQALLEEKLRATSTQIRDGAKYDDLKATETLINLGTKTAGRMVKLRKILDPLGVIEAADDWSYGKALDHVEEWAAEHRVDFEEAVQHCKPASPLSGSLFMVQCPEKSPKV